MSVIQERVPAGGAEVMHYHNISRQFFYILEGEGTMVFEDREVTLSKGQGLEIGEPANVAYRQSDGELAVKLAMTEIFLIDSLKASGALIEKLNRAWQWTPSAPRPAQGYPLPRQDSHGWFPGHRREGAGYVRQDLRSRSYRLLLRFCRSRMSRYRSVPDSRFPLAPPSALRPASPPVRSEMI